MTQTVAPGVVEMKDASCQPYLVDTDLSYILANRRVWTHPETGELMIDELMYHQKQMVVTHPLAKWWYRIMSLSDLPKDEELYIEFKNNDKRRVVYTNLRLVKGHSANVLQEELPTTHP